MRGALFEARQLGAEIVEARWVRPHLMGSALRRVVPVIDERDHGLHVAGEPRLRRGATTEIILRTVPPPSLVGCAHTDLTEQVIDRRGASTTFERAGVRCHALTLRLRDRAPVDVHDASRQIPLVSGWTQFGHKRSENPGQRWSTSVRHKRRSEALFSHRPCSRKRPENIHGIKRMPCAFTPVG